MIDLRGSRFTDIMPENLASQLETQAFAYAVGCQVEKLTEYAERVHIYAVVDAIPEHILDVLAVELRTPAYKQDFSIDVKRALVKGTLPFYARMGTPAACNYIIEAISEGGNIEEWFDYGGEPHHFRVHVTRDHSVVSIEEFEEFIRTIFFVKRLSSWLDEIIVTIHFPPSTLHVGGGMGAQVQIGVPLEPDIYSFQNTLHAGGSLASEMSLPVPEDTTQPSTTTILRTGGVCTIISNLSGED